MLLDALDILEEAVSLVLEDLSGESGGRLRRYNRWVESVQHCNTVVLVEWTELELVDQDPPPNPDIELGVEGVNLALLLLD